MSNRLTIEQKLNIIKSNTHLGVQFIMQILNIGHEKAHNVIKDCNTEIHRLGYRNYHDRKVPTDIFLKVTGLDVEFMESQIQKSPSAN